MFKVFSSLLLFLALCSECRHHGHPKEDLEDFLDTDEMLAMEHSEKVSEAGACDLPKQQVVHVNEHYPDRYFLPHCILLHRCGKHAGCCGTDRLRCVAKTKEKVALYFYSVQLGNEQGTPSHGKVEKLFFYNHTQCACTEVQHASKYDF